MSSSIWGAATHETPLTGTERIPCDTASGGSPTYFAASDMLAYIFAAIATKCSITLAAGAANSINVTITMQNAASSTIAAVHDIEVFIAEDSAGVTGLTADVFSGALTASTGVILTALTATKHIIATTAASGILVLNLVASAKPTDQYFCVKIPSSGQLIVSAASGTSWGA